MTIIADATSLILLAKIELLELFAERNDTVVPRVAYDEVVKGKEKSRKDAFLVERLVSEKKLKIKSPSNETKAKIAKTFNVKGGELEVLALSFAARENEIILSDDKKCINAAKALKISFITTLDVVVVLHRKGAISKERASQCLEDLEEYGWYAKDLIKKYKVMIK